MSINRISSAYLTNQSVNALHTNSNILSKIQERISSGKNINKPSDDPVGLTRILALANTINADERFTRNVDQALAEVTAGDVAMTSMTGLIHRAQELATQGANATLNQAARDAIALEVNEIVNQMVQLGNTSIAGKYIFAGMKTNAPPFSRPAVPGDDVLYAGTPLTEDYNRPVEIAQGVTLNINVNGDALLGTVQVTALGPPPTFSAGSSGIIKTLVNLKLDLQNGDANEIRNRLDDLTAGLNQVLAQQSKIGSITNRLELTKSRIEERKAILTQQYSSIQDIDLPKAVSDLNFQESIYNASLGVMARVLQPTILNFLR